MTARSEDEIRADLAIVRHASDENLVDDTAYRLWHDIPELLDSRERAIRWAVTLEGQNAAMEARIADVDLIRRAINDPAQFLPRGENYTEPIGSWSARAVVAALTGSTEDAATDQCKNGHPFEPGVDIDMVREGRSPSPLWCNVCGASR